MTSLPDGGPNGGTPQRQVMVVEEDPGKRQRLCALLTRHGLAVHPISASDLAMQVQGWSGVIVVGSSSKNGHASGSELAERIRTFDAHVPIILLGHLATTDPSMPPPTIQACLPPEPLEDALIVEVTRWLKMAPPPPAPKGMVGTVLVVDDDPKFREILRNFLELRGFVVAAAGSGEEGLAVLKDHQPGVVLLDLRMPGMDGLLTLKHLRMAYPNLPVLILSNLDEGAVMEEAGLLGVNDYLVKPFNFEHLENVLLTKIFA